LKAVEVIAGKRRDFCAKFARNSRLWSAPQAVLREDVCQVFGRCKLPQLLCAVLSPALAAVLSATLAVMLSAGWPLDFGWTVPGLLRDRPLRKAETNAPPEKLTPAFVTADVLRY